MAASLDRGSGRRTWEGSRDRWPPGAVRSAMARCRRPGRARTRRRVRTATPRLRRARCRPRLPTREQTCRGWPPSGPLPLLSRTSRPPHRGGAPGRPGSASRCRRGSRPRSGISCSPAQGAEQIGVELGDTRNVVVEDRRAVGDGTVSLAKRPNALAWVVQARRARTASRARTPSTGGRGLRRSPRERRAGRRHGSCESESGGALFVLVGCRSRRHSRQRGVASTYAVFDTPTICAGS